MGMSKINTSGPAFPTQVASYESMTLRDYFAAQAMQSMLPFYSDMAEHIQDVATKAYAMADLMLKAREHCADAGPADVEELFMTECQHEWTPVEGQPMYKCIRCNAFMVLCK